ncbi:uncharacterized protein LOC133218208 isoform X2 [Neopsephotus bourkii]|uniref:uncharacterized protein LOC133218208 isoform X2 n=1 Tax=Neopsephotus bourkii TaxID=309878 RepID=UPI002AA59A6D|nr:uncharacterized protein LOC133218208 isoform X2 [Neopsephotus bourkii]
MCELVQRLRPSLGDKLPKICNSALGKLFAKGKPPWPEHLVHTSWSIRDHRSPAGHRSAGRTAAKPGSERGAARSSPRKSHFLPPLGRLETFPSRGAEHRRATPERRMTKFLMAALLVLHLSLGNAELEGEEDISEFLYDYASRFSDYLYATVEYYSENSTILPTTYSYGAQQLGWRPGHGHGAGNDTTSSKRSRRLPLQ